MAHNYSRRNGFIHSTTDGEPESRRHAWRTGGDDTKQYRACVNNGVLFWGGRQSNEVMPLVHVPVIQRADKNHDAEIRPYDKRRAYRGGGDELLSSGLH